MYATLSSQGALLKRPSCSAQNPFAPQSNGMAYKTLHIQPPASLSSFLCPAPTLCCSSHTALLTVPVSNNFTTSSTPKPSHAVSPHFQNPTAPSQPTSAISPYSKSSWLSLLPLPFLDQSEASAWCFPCTSTGITLTTLLWLSFVYLFHPTMSSHRAEILFLIIVPPALRTWLDRKEAPTKGYVTKKIFQFKYRNRDSVLHPIKYVLKWKSCGKHPLRLAKLEKQLARSHFNLSESAGNQQSTSQGSLFILEPSNSTLFSPYLLC